MRLLLVSLLLCASPVPSPVRAAEPPVRSLEVRASDALRESSISLVLAESFASFDDARAYVANVRRRDGIDLAKLFGPYGYEAAVARNFLSVAGSEDRLLTDDKVEARWIVAYLCIDKRYPERAHAAAKALQLVEKGVNDQLWCMVDAWSKPIPRKEARDLATQVASAGYSGELVLEVADVVIILGKALTPAERSKLEGMARDHGIPVRVLRSAYSEGD